MHRFHLARDVIQVHGDGLLLKKLNALDPDLVEFFNQTFVFLFSLKLVNTILLLWLVLLRHYYLLETHDICELDFRFTNITLFFGVTQVQRVESHFMNDFSLSFRLPTIHGQVVIISKESLDKFVCWSIVEHDLTRLVGENEYSLVHTVQYFSVFLICKVQLCMYI